MKKEDEKIDALIKEALSEEEAQYYMNLGEQNVIEEFGGLFKGRNSWMTIVVTVAILAFVILAVYAVIGFANAAEVKEMLQWTLVFTFSMIAVAMLKIWSWQQMDKNTILREMKKLELQISALVQKISKDQN